MFKALCATMVRQVESWEFGVLNEEGEGRNEEQSKSYESWIGWHRRPAGSFWRPAKTPSCLFYTWRLRGAPGGTPAATGRRPVPPESKQIALIRGKWEGQEKILTANHAKYANTDLPAEHADGRRRRFHFRFCVTLRGLRAKAFFLILCVQAGPFFRVFGVVRGCDSPVFLIPGFAGIIGLRGGAWESPFCKSLIFSHFSVGNRCQ